MKTTAEQILEAQKLLIEILEAQLVHYKGLVKSQDDVMKTQDKLIKALELRNKLTLWEVI